MVGAGTITIQQVGRLLPSTLLASCKRTKGGGEGEAQGRVQLGGYSKASSCLERAVRVLWALCRGALPTSKQLRMSCNAQCSKLQREDVSPLNFLPAKVSAVCHQVLGREDDDGAYAGPS